MKKIISVLLAVFMLTLPFTAFAEPTENTSSDITMEDQSLTPPDISHSEAALLMDMKTGRLILGKNTQKKLYPASTTKMMTGIIALENGNLSDKVTATYDAIKDITLGDSHMGILIGEEFTLEQLISGMLVYSANDAANVIAIHLAGSVEAFAEMMNKKAQELGMTNTHFVNACGIHNDDHYTTAEDLAKLAQYCMQNEKFREIVKMPIYSMPATNKYAQERNLQNTNLFLSSLRSSYHYYEPCTGIKTGHTDKAGYCLVSSAEYKDISLLAVVLNAKNTDTQAGAYSYVDSKNMFEFGFNNYSSKKLASPGDVVHDSKVYEAKGGTRVALTVPEDIYVLLSKSADVDKDISASVELVDENLTAPIEQGTVLGKVTYSANGVQLASSDLVAANSVKQDKLLHVIHFIVNIIKSPFFFVPVILIIILLIFSANQKKKRAKKRRMQQLKRSKSRVSDTSRRIPDRNASGAEMRDIKSKGSNSRYGK